jgi:tRNA pseudouridine38-40 synthase
MLHLKLTIAYDGTGLVGWQRQLTGMSVQALLEEALAPLEGAPVRITGAGRTDAGVHALAQVASVVLHRPIAPAAVVRAMNMRLPPAVRVI